MISAKRTRKALNQEEALIPGKFYGMDVLYFDTSIFEENYLTFVHYIH